MENWKKLLALSSISILLLFSCSQLVSYEFIINKFGDADVKNVKFTFTESIGERFREHDYTLAIGGKPEIRVRKGTTYSGMEYKGWAKVHIRPNPSDLPNGGKVELFIHNPITTTKMSDSRYEVNSTSGVLAYFVDYVLQDRVLTTISRSNSIQLSRDLKNVRRQWSLEDISGDFEDFTVIDAYTQLGKGGLEESGGIIGGYIVRSTINGAIVMLN